MRLRLFVILLGALVVAATFTFPYWQPLFNRQVVEEAFPGLPSDLQESFAALPATQQTAYLTLLDEDAATTLEMVRAALQPPEPIDEELPAMGAPVTIAIGEFIEMDVIRGGRGTVTIYQMPDNSKILRLQDFSVTNGPDLRVVLSASEAPKTREEVELNDLDLELGRLKSNSGNQNYDIAAEIDMNQYNSVVILSRMYGTVFSSADIG